MKTIIRYSQTRQKFDRLIIALIIRQETHFFISYFYHKSKIPALAKKKTLYIIGALEELTHTQVSEGFTRRNIGLFKNIQVDQKTIL